MIYDKIFLREKYSPQSNVLSFWVVARLKQEIWREKCLHFLFELYYLLFFLAEKVEGSNMWHCVSYKSLFYVNITLTPKYSIIVTKTEMFSFNIFFQKITRINSRQNPYHLSISFL